MSAFFIRPKCVKATWDIILLLNWAEKFLPFTDVCGWLGGLIVAITRMIGIMHDTLAIIIGIIILGHELLKKSMLKFMLIKKDFKHGVWLAGSCAASQSNARFENLWKQSLETTYIDWKQLTLAGKKSHFYSSPPGQNGCYFGTQQFQMHLFKKNDRIPIRISLNFVPRSPTDNKPALVQVMAWCQRGDKPLPEPILT